MEDDGRSSMGGDVEIHVAKLLLGSEFPRRMLEREDGWTD